MDPKKASYTAVFISVFGGFSLNDRQRRIKKYAFSYENALVWTGENKTKILVWSENICCVFIETRTNTCKYALV